jgi:hypothetical protein
MDVIVPNTSRTNAKSRIASLAGNGDMSNEPGTLWRTKKKHWNANNGKPWYFLVVSSTRVVLMGRNDGGSKIRRTCHLNDKSWQSAGFEKIGE